LFLSKSLLSRTVARKFSIGGFVFVWAGGLDIIKLTKTPFIYSISRFNLGGLGALFGGSKPPRGDGTASETSQSFSTTTSHFKQTPQKTRPSSTTSHPAFKAATEQRTLFKENRISLSRHLLSVSLMDIMI